MKKVTLRFTNEEDLRRFTMIATCDYLRMNIKDLTLICDADEAELGLAQRAFNATIISVIEE